MVLRATSLMARIGSRLARAGKRDRPQHDQQAGCQAFQSGMPSTNAGQLIKLERKTK